MRVGVLVADNGTYRANMAFTSYGALAFTHRSKHKRVAANVAAPAKHAEVEERLSARELATIRANAVKGAVVRCLKASKALTLAELTARVTQRLAHFCAPHASDVEQAIDSLVDKGVSLPRPQLVPAPATVLFLALHFAAVHSSHCHCRSHWQQQCHRHHHCRHHTTTTTIITHISNGNGVPCFSQPFLSLPSTATNTKQPHSRPHVCPCRHATEFIERDKTDPTVLRYIA